MMFRRYVAILMVTALPSIAMADTGSTGCAALAQAAVDGAAARIQADDTSIPAPQSVALPIELWPGVLTDFGPASVLNLGFARFCREARSGLESQVGIVRAAPSGA